MLSKDTTERFQNPKFFFRVQKWGWRIVGFWPGVSNVSFLGIFLAVVNSIEVLIYSVFQLLYCYSNTNNLVLLLDALTPVLTQITTAIKVLIIVARRDDLKFVLLFLKKSFCEGIFFCVSITIFVARVLFYSHFRSIRRWSENPQKSVNDFICIWTDSLCLCELDQFVFLSDTNCERLLPIGDGHRTKL